MQSFRRMATSGEDERPGTRSRNLGREDGDHQLRRRCRVGLQQGSVLYWDLRHPDLSPVVLKQQDGQSVTAMASYHVPGSNGSSLVVSKGSNASLSMYTGNTWTSLQNPAWGSGVTHMTTFNSADSSTPGIIVTLADKSVQQWYRGSGTTANVWKSVKQPMD